MRILTLIKNCFKRYVRQELVDFPQDIGFVSKRRVFIPDLDDVFPVSNADADAHNLVIWGKKKKKKEKNNSWSTNTGS